MQPQDSAPRTQVVPARALLHSWMQEYATSSKLSKGGAAHARDVRLHVLDRVYAALTGVMVAGIELL